MMVAARTHEMIEGDLIPSFSLSGVNVSGQVFILRSFISTFCFVDDRLSSPRDETHQ